MVPREHVNLVSKLRELPRCLQHVHVHAAGIFFAGLYVRAPVDAYDRDAAHIFPTLP
jgi:hypothetical protein